ncbi:MAG: hypothetical protein M3Y40_06835, partial [Chloroflexota bacterium]|nr:hypothetical protein [Chloroflexota bacterium]
SQAVRRYRFWREWRTGRPVDYGATSSLRMDAATGIDDLAHNHWADARRAADMVQVQILDALVELLRPWPVNLARLEADVERIHRERSISINRRTGSVFDLGWNMPAAR